MSRRERIKNPRHGYYREFKNWYKETIKGYESIPCCNNNYHKMHGGVLIRHISISKAKHRRDRLMVKGV